MRRHGSGGVAGGRARVSGDRSSLAISPSRQVSSRTFLRGTGVAASLVAAPWFRRADAFQDAATPQPTLTDAAWDDLAKRLQGRLLRPGDDMYPPATVINATRYMGVRPAGIAVCIVPEDAAACVSWARET